LDTYGSRSLTVGGVAIVKAADKVIEKAKKIAAHLLEANEADLEFAAGKFRVAGSPGSEVGIADIALAVFAAHNLPDGVEPSLDSDATFDPENFSFPHGTHLCAVEIDTETGMTKIRKYVCVDDVGVPINPLIIEGQVHGGLAQGIAQALFEEAVYDDSGNLTTGTFVDYTLPSASDLPWFTTERTETPSTTNPLGVKGVGEPARSHPPPPWSMRSSTRYGNSACPTSACRRHLNGYGVRFTEVAANIVRPKALPRTAAPVPVPPTVRAVISHDPRGVRLRAAGQCQRSGLRAHGGR
jgi:CO/xanthine dehydrogenase Mo-binding subunit